jgi:hypothetical protein
MQSKINQLQRQHWFHRWCGRAGNHPVPPVLGVAATGLALLLVTGPIMFSAEATAFGRNPVFLSRWC